MIHDPSVLDETYLAALEKRETCIGTANIGEQGSMNPGHCLLAL
jgi:hypothetical protein